MFYLSKYKNITVHVHNLLYFCEFDPIKLLGTIARLECLVWIRPDHGSVTDWTSN